MKPYFKGFMNLDTTYSIKQAVLQSEAALCTSLTGKSNANSPDLAVGQPDYTAGVALSIHCTTNELATAFMVKMCLDC